ncbi:hypothetical protein HDU83_002272 [Entophlyctis luteolus]|nr:hypothetical protein HDU83_002272 [Entophlyctis luteolus]
MSFGRGTRVACMIIGDEVLGGKTLDTNSAFLAKLCFETGLTLRRIMVVPDEEHDIVKTIRELSNEFKDGHVFTSGGIGPTHDDITYDSLARAFNLSLIRHEPTISLMQQLTENRNPRAPFEMNAGRLRMATLPSPSRICFPSKDLWVPVVTVNENVHIFPGVPRLFQQLVTRFVENEIVPANVGMKRYIRREIGTEKPESEIMEVLIQWQKRAEKLGVKIGSYPKFAPVETKSSDGNVVKLRVVVSAVGTDPEAVESISNGVKADLGAFELDK